MTIHSQLNEAILIFCGVNDGLYSLHPENRIIKKYGLETGQLLLKKIDEILKIMDMVKPDWNIVTLEQAADMAINLVVKKHNNLNQESLEALKNQFFFWWK
jgi:hypothetical protein